MKAGDENCCLWLDIMTLDLIITLQKEYQSLPQQYCSNYSSVSCWKKSKLPCLAILVFSCGYLSKNSKANSSMSLVKTCSEF